MKPISKSIKTGILPDYGIRLKTKSKILPKEECGGFLVKEIYLDNRKPNTEGEYVGYVPGCGGDVWWVKHMDGTVGAYEFNELTDI